MKKIQDYNLSELRNMASQFEKGDVFSNQCLSREVLRYVTGKWGMLVLAALADGKQHRFSALRRKILGVSEKMLAQTLQQLEQAGFVERIVFPEVPPHVEYTLTPLGLEFSCKVMDLILWLETNLLDLLEK